MVGVGGQRAFLSRSHRSRWQALAVSPHFPLQKVHTRPSSLCPTPRQTNLPLPRDDRLATTKAPADSGYGAQAAGITRLKQHSPGGRNFLASITSSLENPPDDALGCTSDALRCIRRSHSERERPPTESPPSPDESRHPTRRPRTLSCDGHARGGGVSMAWRRRANSRVGPGRRTRPQALTSRHKFRERASPIVYWPLFIHCPLSRLWPGKG